MRMEQWTARAAREDRKAVGAPSRETIKQRMRWLMLDEEDDDEIVEVRFQSTSSLKGQRR